MTARIGLMMAFSAGIMSAAGNDFSYVAKPGDQVGKIAQLYTGKASNWRKAEVRVVHANGKPLPKSEENYRRRFYPGDTVLIAKSLVPTITEKVSHKSLADICKQFVTKNCEVRLQLINELPSPSQVVEEIRVPSWFATSVPPAAAPLSSVTTSPAPSLPSATSSRPSVVPSPPVANKPAKAWPNNWIFWALLLLIGLVAAAVTAAVLGTKPPGALRNILPPAIKRRITARMLAQEIRRQLRSRGENQFQVLARNSLVYIKYPPGKQGVLEAAIDSAVSVLALRIGQQESVERTIVLVS